MTSSTPELRFPAWPQFGDSERTGLIRALEQGQWWRVTGTEVDAFEEEFAAYNGAGHALAVTNGTHALELALQVLGVGRGDEVIVPAFTFFSSAQAAQRLGAVAVPVDVDPDTYNIDPAAVEAAITPATKVIMPVHMAGLMADMDALGKLAADAGVALLQDAAHAQGAEWRGTRVGDLGSIATYSFQNGKLMTAGEGGAVTFPTAELREEAFVRHSCGRPLSDRHYLHRNSASNFRMNEFTAAVLRAQLARLDEQTAVRDQRWPLLSGLLGQIPGVRPQGGDDRVTRTVHYMAMFRVPGIGELDRNALVDRLVGLGIPAFAAFRALHRVPGFWETGAPDETAEAIAARCPNTEAISTDCIWLHHRALLADEATLHTTAELIAHAVANR
jgi:3-amino-5-hydroxybenzoate synthase